MAIASLVLGIVSILLVLSGLGAPIALVTSIIGIVLGGMSRKKQSEGNGMATAGLVCSIISLIIVVLVFAFGGMLLSAFMS